MIDIFTEEALCILFGLDIDADDYDTCDLEELLTDKAQNEGLATLIADLMERLCGLIDVGNSPMTGERYKGFKHPEINHLWLIKTKAENEAKQ